MKEIPKYMVIANQLRQRIASGDFSDTGQLPQEKRLIQAYNVSRITIRKALDVLVTENLIYRVQGAGTYIKDQDSGNKPVNQNQIELFNTEELKVKIDNFSVIKPNAKVASMMEVNRYDFVYVVERQLYLKEKPVVYQQLFFPIKYIQGVRMDALKTSITSFLINELGIDITNVNRQFKLDQLNEGKAKQLNMDSGTTVLLIQEKMFLQDGAIGVYDQSWINTELYPYNVKLFLK
ncbi:GntR family transcriptional regulator [Pediococcus acidilactici]|uniref:GntR family transcriptional regulator n=1 Tax=Pediococcus acidilactici TaxID=1254 RepID=UPI001869FB06|nr:GntR family transcriptional regulator [Pediococcus acidilactici]MCH9266992.1 GntR family transcriptional regulator [Pediococcus acidilactici]MCI1276573.1 GntR family transcriptional regulator [Pediococcus acidilactici]MCK2074393.1 GntR family transcriptional regulator [Pediococcus acidilactici]MDV2603790.1 GntR family transcriptional regulator [Pediococcus acidilactici]MDV2845208.1 GntR family transcriptional regulator [Pediococcus acidilactici]